MYAGKNFLRVSSDAGSVQRLTIMNTGKFIISPHMPACMLHGLDHTKLHSATTMTPATSPAIAPALVALGQQNTPSIQGKSCPIKPYATSRIYTSSAGFVSASG